jgi:hypothetical protein
MKPSHFQMLFAQNSILLIVAMGPMPYFYYDFLRATMIVGAIFVAIRVIQTRKFHWLGLSVISLIFFWPGFHLEKESWFFVDAAISAIWVLASMFLAKPMVVTNKDSGKEESDGDSEGNLQAFYLGAAGLIVIALFMRGLQLNS